MPETPYEVVEWPKFRDAVEDFKARFLPEELGRFFPPGSMPWHLFLDLLGDQALDQLLIIETINTNILSHQSRPITLREMFATFLFINVVKPLRNEVASHERRDEIETSKQIQRIIGIVCGFIEELGFDLKTSEELPGQVRLEWRRQDAQ